MSDELSPEDQLTSISYLALGDSYTIGEGVEERMRWPIQLSNRLNSSLFEVEETTIIARTGWTTRDLIDAINNRDPQQHDLVSLLIGVNNQYQGQPFEQFISELDSLINIAISLSGEKSRVFMVSIPDYGVTPFGESNKEIIAKEIDLYNAHIEERCSLLGIPFINITEISRELGSSDNALAPDRLHPSGAQYTRWVGEILPAVKELLSR